MWQTCDAGVLQPWYGSPMIRDCLRVGLLLISSLSGIGCPELKQGGPSQVCAKAYEQCTLKPGVLGVCDTVPCAEGATPPCLICRSQH